MNCIILNNPSNRKSVNQVGKLFYRFGKIVGNPPGSICISGLIFNIHDADAVDQDGFMNGDAAR